MFRTSRDCSGCLECAHNYKSWMQGAAMRRLSLLVSAFLCANVLAQTPAAAPPAGPVPIEHFTRFDEFSGLKISPDGEFVALRTGKHGRSALLFVDLKNKKIVSGVRAPENGEIAEYYWISPTRLVYMLAQRFAGRTQPVP